MIEHSSDTNSADDDTSVISSMDIYTPSNINDLSSLLQSYFSSHFFSLPSSDSYDVLTLACHNVRGLNDPVKQSQLLNLTLDKDISILGLSGTKLSLSASKHLFTDQPLFRSFWSPHPTRQFSGGVGLIIKNPYARHIQKVHKWKGRIISADLYFNSFKLKVINVYVPPRSLANNVERSDTHQHLLSLIESSKIENCTCIIMGDLNVDAFQYNDLLSSPQYRTPAKFSLLERLIHDNYLDNCAIHNDSPLPTYTYRNSSTNASSHSRLDYIWLSPNFPIDDIIHTELIDSSPYYDSDHFMLMSHFSFTSINSTLSKARLKQKQESRRIVLHHSITINQWDQFRLKVDNTLMTNPKFSINSSMNVKWLNLKQLIRDTALEIFPKKLVSNTHRSQLPNHLSLMKHHLAYLSASYACFNEYIIRYDPSKITLHWFDRYNKLSHIITHYRLQDPNFSLTRYFPPSLSNLDTTILLKSTKQCIAHTKRMLAKRLSTELSSYNFSRIKDFSETRCENFHVNKGKFISSALSRVKRFITLDRVLITDDNSRSFLLTDPNDIKKAAVTHYQNSVPPPLPRSYNISSFPDRWKSRYSPIDTVDDTIYNHLLAPITLNEWFKVIRSTPLNKAAGPSSITYEYLKHLGDTAHTHMLSLMNDCFIANDIPSGWREATVYPIPKPYEWEARLQNTRPITLLETARKCFVKIINNRLSAILSSNSVLQGNNFAGLPGGLCTDPIQILNSIIHHSHSTNSPLWILSQDISKAFDSMDLNMLNLAMIRIKLPFPCRKLILNLFTNRTNKILTCFGQTSSYKVQVGIDQGEIISPLLWVIYLDPLLSELNYSASAPFSLDSSVLKSVYPRSYTERHLSFSQLTFMDDSTLIASSKNGLSTLLSITEEFYMLNNTKANHSKYVLLSTGLVNPKDIIFSLTPSSLNNTSQILIRSLGHKDSFRFLGVWFDLSFSKRFVLSQIKKEYLQFTNILRHKKLTGKQLTYLHNSVLLPKVEYRAQVTPSRIMNVVLLL